MGTLLKAATGTGVLFKIHLKPWLHFTFQCGRGQEQLKPLIKTQHFFLLFSGIKASLMGWSKTKQKLWNFSQCESKNALRGGISVSDGGEWVAKTDFSIPCVLPATEAQGYRHREQDRLEWADCQHSKGSCLDKDQKEEPGEENPSSPSLCCPLRCPACPACPQPSSPRALRLGLAGWNNQSD